MSDLQSLRLKYHGIRWILLGAISIVIGVSQAAFGWIGSSNYLRIIYPILCCGLSPMPFYIGLRLLRSTKPSAADQLSTNSVVS